MSFLPKFFNALSRRTSRRTPVAETAEDIIDIEVTPEYKKILGFVEGGAPVTLVSGAGGTGKSTLIRYLAKTLRRKIVKLAPTGVAAINIGGQTLHSFFQFPHQILTQEHVKRMYQKKLYKQIGLLIIDEVSMVRPDVLDAMDYFLRINGPDSAKPFGGIQLLLIGDHFQLPPVTPPSEDAVLRQLGYHYERHYWFHAKCVQEIPIEYVELTHIYRQTDAHFIDLLSKLRVGNDLGNVIKEINDTCFDNEYQSDLCTTVTATNKVADSINQTKFDTLSGEVHRFDGKVTGKFTTEKNRLPAPSELFLKKGTRVMFTKNDSRKRWVNGSAGIVEDINNGEIRVKLLSSGLIYTVEKARWQNIKYVYDSGTGQLEAEVIGEYIQYPLKWGWAITIHKSQGKTLDEIIIDLGDGGAFETGQVYVALSRCRTMGNIHLRRHLNLSDVKWCPLIKEFDDFLSNHHEVSDDVLSLSHREQLISNEDTKKSYEPWTIEEDNQLVTFYKAGTSIKRLARIHKRTVGAIRSRLTKLGVIEAVPQ